VEHPVAEYELADEPVPHPEERESIRARSRAPK
jgi:hypothetical protein